MEESKVKTVIDWKAPTNVRELDPSRAWQLLLTVYKG